MIDIKDLEYRVVAVTKENEAYNITDYVESLGWEENDRELSVRISFTVCNRKTNYGKLSSLVKPGCLVAVFADCGTIKREAARGYVVEWKQSSQGSGEVFEAVCYDELYNLQESQDDVYFGKGMKTRSLIAKIFTKWKIPIGKYEGPDIIHGKIVYRSENLSDIITDILEEAGKKSGKKPLLRAEKGKLHVLEWGSNDSVYHFEAANTKLVSYSMSTSGLVTRVKVISQEKEGRRRKVEAAADGLTQYGIRQKIYVRDKDDSLDAAKKAAQAILNEEGKPKKQMSVQAPDVPFIRKGDMVSVKAGALNGYYLVKGIHHDGDNMAMTMELKKVPGKKGKDLEDDKEAFGAGDMVWFKGGTHYVDSYKDSKGFPAGQGLAKITKINGRGKAHPWHLVHMDDGNVCGWVDEGTFIRADEKEGMRGDGISWQSGNK